jgi:hypothetical protein
MIFGRVLFYQDNKNDALRISSRGFCVEQLHLLASHGCLYIIVIITYMFDLSIVIRYLVSTPLM